MENKKLGVLIMRAQPLHAGHRDLIRKARLDCDRLIILIGSANSPRTIKNPFTFREREIEITTFLEHEYSDNRKNDIYTYPLNDYRYSNFNWLSDVNSIIEENKLNHDVILFGHFKEGNNYLNWFPQYQFQNIDATYDVNATSIRNVWFTEARHKFHPDVLEDYDYFTKEKKLFAEYPFPDTLNFNCGDVVLECARHVLLIKRKFAPGRNTWALPGGFKNSNETFLECAIRELIEETNIDVSESILHDSIVGSELFDQPNRGCGLNRTTLAVHIRIRPNSDGTLPQVNGIDDASLAEWKPIASIMDEMDLFDDHSHIIQKMGNVMPSPAHKNGRYRFQN